MHLICMKRQLRRTISYTVIFLGASSQLPPPPLPTRLNHPRNYALQEIDSQVYASFIVDWISSHLFLRVQNIRKASKHSERWNG